jgi:hypothetical protein
MSAAPIFIVGVPRSGTTLLAAMLAAHSRISCGPETHFFRRLAAVDADRLVGPASWPETAVDFICGIRHAAMPGHESRNLIEKYDMDCASVAAYLAGREPAVASILGSVVEPYMRSLDKSRWAEKTPDHIEHLPLIRRHFPQSPIVRIVRDPRDVALSLMQVPWGTSSFLEGLLLWRRQDAASEPFFAQDFNTLTLRFEQLVLEPQAVIEALCRFVGEDFEPAMLDTSVSGRQVNSRGVAWKDKVGQPPDSSRVAVWRRQLSKPQNQLAEAVLGDRLAAYGYPQEARFQRWASLYPSWRLAGQYASALELVASQRVRFWQASPDERPSAQVFLGDPTGDHWLAEHPAQRLAGATSLAARITAARLVGRQVYWASALDDTHWTGYLSALLKWLLRQRRLPATRPALSGPA